MRMHSGEHVTAHVCLNQHPFCHSYTSRNRLRSVSGNIIKIINDLISLSPQIDKSLKSVTHGQCNTRLVPNYTACWL